MAEEQLRKSMAISQGDLAYLVHSPFAIIAYSTLAVIIALGMWLKRRKARLEASAPSSDVVPEREAQHAE